MNITDSLERLQQATGIVYSDEQKKLIASEGGACVLACAGSGKTTTLTHMILRRLLDGSIRKPSRLLGITFSKAGADEMKERLDALAEKLDMDAEVKMKTVHAFCLEFLQEVDNRLFRNVLDASDSMKMLRDCASRVCKRMSYEDVDSVSQLLGYQRGRLLSQKGLFNDYLFKSSGISDDDYAAISAAYEQAKRDAGVIDFSDMLLYALKYLQDPNYSEQWSRRYSHIMVDEAQDMSTVQFEIVKYLLGKGVLDEREHIERVKNSLILIGDDDQCQPAGTRITLSDGVEKNIEDIEVGDRVLAHNRLYGQYVSKPVTAVSSRETDSLIQVTAEEGHISRYTGNHRCYARIKAKQKNPTQLQRVKSRRRAQDTGTVPGQRQLNLKRRTPKPRKPARVYPSKATYALNTALTTKARKPASLQSPF